MQEFQKRFEDEQGFDEEAQRQIIAVAAALQRDYGQRASLSDLERAAVEAGIEPRFVREAVERHRIEAVTVPAQAVPSSDAVWVTAIVSVLFVLAEVMIMRSRYWGNIAEAFSHTLLKQMTLGILLGIALPRASSLRRLAAALPIVTAFLFALWHSRLISDGFNYGERWPLWLWLGTLQAAVAVSVHILRSRGWASKLAASITYQTDSRH